MKPKGLQLSERNSPPETLLKNTITPGAGHDSVASTPTKQNATNKSDTSPSSPPTPRISNTSATKSAQVKNQVSQPKRVPLRIKISVPRMQSSKAHRSTTSENSTAWMSENQAPSTTNSNISNSTNSWNKTTKVEPLDWTHGKPSTKPTKQPATTSNVASSALGVLLLDATNGTKVPTSTMSYLPTMGGPVETTVILGAEVSRNAMDENMIRKVRSLP